MRRLGVPVLLALLTALGCACSCAAEVTRLRVSPSGHYVRYGGRALALVGDSGTQCVLQDLNLDYRRWLDDCHARGIRAVHVWSFVAPRQKQDGSVLEARYGYVYPGATPWARRDGGPAAFDQLPQWDLTRFDEGTDPKAHYWPRLRDLCAYAQARGIVVGITVFFGWPKHNRPERPDWSYHPFNVLNGGHLVRTEPITTGCQEIASPGEEVLQEAWDPAWPPPKKTQWVWERFSEKLIDDTRAVGNVFFVFMDEHSYPEGNCGDHFAAFLRKRGALWVDWDRRWEAVDVVMTDTFSSEDKNAAAVEGFGRTPARPIIHLEGGPYQGTGVRTALWTFVIGGGHCFFHDDSDQGAVTRGIMGYDPHVPGGDTNPTARDWIGHASRFFNEQLSNLDAMAPHNELVKSGSAYCLADLGGEWAVYSVSGAEFTLNLATATRTARWYDPRTGEWFGEAFPLQSDAAVVVRKPSADDWTLYIAAP
ncbi:MAG: hypothetical protein FJX75_15140 [Armatimonadetes bacterium]|nr:hypothetical protein [Armatimonadota bacterium]